MMRQDLGSAKSLRNENLRGSGLRDGGRHKVKRMARHGEMESRSASGLCKATTVIRQE